VPSTAAVDKLTAFLSTHFLNHFLRVWSGKNKQAIFRHDQLGFATLNEVDQIRRELKPKFEGVVYGVNICLCVIFRQRRIHAPLFCGLGKTAGLVVISDMAHDVSEVNALFCHIYSLASPCKKVHLGVYLFIPMLDHLSESDKKVYTLIRNRLVHGLDAPTLREINEVTERSSPRSAVLSLERLEKAGLIRRAGRRIRLTSPSLESNSSVSTVEVPLVGGIAAGAPMLAEENVEAIISVSTALARPGSTYFLLRVVGTSMNQARVSGVSIDDGSIVLVRQQGSADDGQIVVALINDEATVKILERKNGVVILRPKSSDPHTPIVLTDNCIIQGVVMGVLPPDLY